MKAIHLALLITFLFSFTACSDDNMDDNTDMTPDTEAPLLENLRWIDSPFYENDPEGPIQNNENYTISIRDGFQMAFNLKDESAIKSQRIFFTVNNDPSIFEEFLSEEIELSPPTDYFFQYFHRVGTISLGNGVFYELKEGDTYQFDMTFTDESDNTTTINWTADLVE